MRAAAEWLATAQASSSDGGVLGRYRLAGGWTSSYPETTGYLVPTMLRLAREWNDPSWRERAGRAVDFLLALQLPMGAFPGGEIHENTRNPSVFNTCQIMNGLTAWYRETGDARTLAAVRRAGDWICEVQDGDGAFRRHVYNGLVTTYTSHASCWLAELGETLGERRYVDAAVRHMDWVLGHRDASTGWIDLAGFLPEDHAARRSVTHTIAYTLWGVLFTALVAGREDAVAAIRESALGIARRVQLSGHLAGVLDHRWRGVANYACLTGNAQMALIWLRLFGIEGDGRFLNAALIALDRIRESQAMQHPDPGIRGGIAGSRPVWGGYIYGAYPNWAAKFYIDAELEARDAVAALPDRPALRIARPEAVPSGPPVVSSTASGGRQTRPLRTVLLTGAYVHKVAQMVEAFRRFGHEPTAVVFENRPDAPAWERIVERCREDGLSWIGDRFGGATGSTTAPDASRPTASVDDGAAWPRDVAAYCAEQKLPIVTVDSLSSAEGLAAVHALRPDLLIHAGAGILRAPLLALPRLGTLNAHMGILPAHRGMNVTEWAIFHRDVVGCTVHLIDPGIDTGDILCAKAVDVADVRSLQEARDRVNEAQIALLAEVVRHVFSTGELPPRRRQTKEEGRQLFRMHPEIRRALDAELAAASLRRPTPDIP